ncbi:hypothetical protein [Labilibaculum antarcticum]|uniref:hypothetical protein n=1 Tax=Labilibaculum antarcticum TaxID=1717717 RepID=UPI000BBA9F50|nr:hypothetical protein [Labilibaculum antarcticum]
MKKVAKIISGFVVLVFLSFLFSPFTALSAPPNGEKGVVVEVIKGTWNLYITDCEGGMLNIPSTENSTTTQFKDGLPHMLTLVFILPDGHCYIPDKAVKEKYGSGLWRETKLWTPDGKLIVKMIYTK